MKGNISVLSLSFKIPDLLLQSLNYDIGSKKSCNLYKNYKVLKLFLLCLIYCNIPKKLYLIYIYFSGAYFAFPYNFYFNLVFFLNI